MYQNRCISSLTFQNSPFCFVKCSKIWRQIQNSYVNMDIDTDILLGVLSPSFVWVLLFLHLLYHFPGQITFYSQQFLLGKEVGCLILEIQGLYSSYRPLEITHRCNQQEFLSGSAAILKRCYTTLLTGDMRGLITFDKT